MEIDETNHPPSEKLQDSLRLCESVYDEYQGSTAIVTHASKRQLTHFFFFLLPEGE
jgi:hypothetical protein